MPDAGRLAMAAVVATGCVADPASKPPEDPWMEVKVAVHVHSTSSHDACDGKPRPAGAPDLQCARDLRDGICGARYDHIFLSDHDVHMAETPWSELLTPLFEEGDAWIGGDDRLGLRIRCADGHEAEVYPGAENDLMPVGLDRHPGNGLAVGSDALHALYDRWGEANVQAFREAGGVTFVNHAEQHTTEEIAGISVDGIEIYNIHATLNAILAGDASAGEISEFLRTDDGAADPDLLFLTLYKDNVEDLTHWSTLSHTRRLSGVAAHDVHRNAVPGPMADGERLDSYRRVLSWYSNRVFVPTSEGPTRTAVRSALKEGRLYVATDVAGDPRGFDAVVVAPDGAELRMGGEGTWQEGMALRLSLPTPPTGATTTYRLVEMRADGTWGDLSTGAGRARIVERLPSAGVYRVEVDITPRHHRDALGDAARLADTPLLWIRTNPFHLR